MVGPCRQNKENEADVSVGEQVALMASLRAAAEVIAKMMPGVQSPICYILVVFLTLVMATQLQVRTHHSGTNGFNARHSGELLGSIALLAKKVVNVIVDTGATKSVAGADSIHLGKNRGPLPVQISLQSASGVQKITEQCDLPAPGDCMDNSLVVQN